MSRRARAAHSYTHVHIRQRPISHKRNSLFTLRSRSNSSNRLRIYARQCFRSVPFAHMRFVFTAHQLIVDSNGCFVDFHIKSAVSLQRETLKQRKSTSSL